MRILFTFALTGIIFVWLLFIVTVAWALAFLSFAWLVSQPVFWLVSALVALIWYITGGYDYVKERKNR